MYVSILKINIHESWNSSENLRGKQAICKICYFANKMGGKGLNGNKPMNTVLTKSKVKVTVLTNFHLWHPVSEVDNDDNVRSSAGWQCDPNKSLNESKQSSNSASAID